MKGKNSGHRSTTSRQCVHYTRYSVGPYTVCMEGTLLEGNITSLYV